MLPIPLIISRNLRLSILTFFAAFTTILSNAQQYYFDNYSVKEGLGQSSVYDILQDTKGYFWIGTAAGLSRFDGRNFINYTSENGLAKDAVQRIMLDSHGNLWFGHKGGGLSRLKNDSIQYIQTDTVVADVSSIVEDNSGNIWVGTVGAGVFKIKNPEVDNLKNLDFIQYKGKQDHLGDLIFSICKTSDGGLYFVTDWTIKFYDIKENSFKDYKPKNLSLFYQFTSLFEDKNGDLWFGTVNGGLYKSNKDGTYTIITDKEGLADNFISTISQDKSGNIWVGTWGGGISVIQKDKILNFNNLNGLPDLKIRCIKEDYEGNVLIGTYENGLCVYKGSKFVNYSEIDGINGTQVWSVLVDKEGNFWFGTEKGISVGTKNGTSFNQYVYFNEENKKLPGNKIRFLKEDGNGDIWIAIENSGILQFKKKSASFDYNFLINGNLQQNKIITAMEIDDNNNLWLGTSNGLINYEINTDKIALVKKVHGLAGDDISALFHDSENHLWIGSILNGITIFNEKDTSFNILKINMLYTPTCITESTDKKIWVGTQAHGVLVFDGLHLLRQFTVADGLLTNYITEIQSGINGDIYIGTSRGLNKFSFKDNRISSYSEKAGFTGIEVKRNASAKDKEGNIWFGTIKGVTKVDINPNTSNAIEPITIISRLRVNLREIKQHPGLTLKYNENSLIFDYSGISLSDPESVEYKIMLEGADLNWRPETNQTTASYSGLQPGTYTFKVMAKNSSGIWNSSPVTFTFTIRPPFWKSIWFYILIGIIILSGFVTFIKMRERNLIREKKMLEEKVEERTIEISKKNKELEIKNTNITDSIKYAKRIQDAMLPDSDYLNTILKEYFILFKPRDIVSGDYYWVAKKDSSVIITAADCTGHGVPGAFMSMLGITLLDEIVNKKNITNTGLILDEMREAVIKSLKQKGIRGETQDGMDVSICAIDTTTLKMQYSGAYHPIFIVRNGELIKLKANRMPIGIYFKQTAPFECQEFQLLKNDIIYLFSDGYPDQFNDVKGEKMMIRNFRNYILEAAKLPMNEQKNFLDEKLMLWKGKTEQIDDILIFGIKISF
ncbi:MAG: two-component regulator propeller domain-containing protein [Bacteroidales bacterium]